MRRPMLLAVLLSVALVVVIFAKMKLDESIKAGKFAESSRPAPDDKLYTVDIGVEQDSALSEASAAHQGAGSSKIDVMAALLEARQSFKAKAEASVEATKDPHATPSVIIRSAETLGRIVTLEKQNPAYKPEFRAFYVDCAKDSAVLTVTRVQCLENYARIQALSAAEEQALLAEVDPIVKQLFLEMKK